MKVTNLIDLLIEKRLITKEYIVTDTHLTFVFKWAVYFSTLAINLFNSGTKLL